MGFERDEFGMVVTEATTVPLARGIASKMLEDSLILLLMCGVSTRSRCKRSLVLRQKSLLGSSALRLRERRLTQNRKVNTLGHWTVIAYMGSDI